MKVRIWFLAAAIFFTAVLPGCFRQADNLKDGYYKAEAADFDKHGWKEYVLIYVSEGRIITVEYDAFTKSGFAKSWDLDYMRTMNDADGTYPNEFSRIYSVALVNWQNLDDIDAVAGATTSYFSFKILAEAAIKKSQIGDKAVALVDIP